MKKLITSNVFINILTILIKYVVSIFGHSFSLLSDAFYDTCILLKYNNAAFIKESNKRKMENVYNIILGGISIVLSAILFLTIFTTPVRHIKWYVILAAIVCFLLTNVKTSIQFHLGFHDEKQDIIHIQRNYVSAMVCSWIVILSCSSSLFSKYVPILEYADFVGTGSISIILLVAGIKYIYLNFQDLYEDRSLEPVKELQALVKQASFIRQVNVCKMEKYGASYRVELHVGVEKELVETNLYSMFVGLCNEIFKRFKGVEVIAIKKNPLKEKKVGNTHARNSRSRNRKKNTTKKNSKQKNKKR